MKKLEIGLISLSIVSVAVIAKLYQRKKINENNLFKLKELDDLVNQTQSVINTQLDDLDSLKIYIEN